MHIYAAAIHALPDPSDPEFPDRASVILSGLRKLQDSLAVATRSDGHGGQRARRNSVSTKEAANGVGLRKDLIEAVEADEPVLEDEASRIKDLIAALGG